jgi:ATP-binding cassette subfamily B (MDR/TAP) protein 1
MRVAAKKCNSVWGVTSGLAEFVMMAMFVQGFWFGGKLVKDKTVSAGDVMAIFWACLIATLNLQLCIPQFLILAKGKFAMASLITLVESSASAPLPGKGPYTNMRRPTYFKNIVPTWCAGELALHNVTFAYPSRPTMPVLEDFSLFLPANEMTFIVGGSGSGKSTVAQLLLKLYEPQSGMIELDDQDITYLDDSFTRQHIAGVSQGCILFDMSVHDNVAMGRAAGQATREEVVEVCRAVLMYEFVRGLPDGYETRLGEWGANLSGGEKQRLAIARAKLKEPERSYSS